MSELTDKIDDLGKYVTGLVVCNVNGKEVDVGELLFGASAALKQSISLEEAIEIVNREFQELESDSASNLCGAINQAFRHFEDKSK